MQNNLSKQPKISVITPSFNHAEYLEECIDSILSQNYPNLEYIIMDGGSTDGSVEIIKKYEKYLAYWQSQPDGGQYAAVHEGFKRSTGDIMGWLNSDDIHRQNCLRTVAAIFLDQSTVDWFTSLPNVINRHGETILVQKPLRWSRAGILSLQRMLAKEFIQQDSTFWRRSLWDVAGGFVRTNFQLAADYELWVRFSRHAQLHSFDEIITSFRYHGENKSADAAAYLAEAATVIEYELENHAEGLTVDSYCVPSALLLTPDTIRLRDML